MTKVIRRRQRKKKQTPSKIVNMPTEIRSDEGDGPDETIHPRFSSLSSTDKNLLSEDNTSAPEIGEETVDNESFASSYPELIDKHIFSQKNIRPIALFLGLLILLIFIFIQDNEAGLLSDFQGVLWSIKKCSYVSGFVISLYLLYLLVNSIQKFIAKKRHR